MSIDERQRKILDEETYKKELFKGMCYMAENFQYHCGRGLSKKLRKNLSFKPETSDKMLFWKIINEKDLGDVPISYRNRNNTRYQAAILLQTSYYPKYEWFDRQELESLRG